MAITGNLSPQTAMALMTAAEQKPVTALNNLQEAAKNLHGKKLDDSAQDFEAMFLSEMIKPMFDTIPVDEEFGGGKGEEVFRSVMVQEYGKVMAKAGGIGLASHVKDALIQAQQHAKTPTPDSEV